MDNLIDSHYFSLTTQGNIYSYVNLSLINGNNKSLFASLKRKVFCCEFLDRDGDIIVPLVKEVPFTYIPSGAEIISMDGFNRSKTYDDFLIGITIIKANGEQKPETYLNIYTEQESDSKEELNLDNIAQNCLMLELSYIPYQLYHTDIILDTDVKEIVWLLCGGDAKIHLFREDPLNHAYSEVEAADLFPEFKSLPSIPVWIDVKYTFEKRRLSAIGFECGLAKFSLVDALSLVILMDVSEQYDAPVICMRLFRTTEAITFPSCIEGPIINKKREIKDSIYNLVIVNTLQPSVVCMDLENFGFSKKFILSESEKYDTATTACVADVNMDGKLEVVLGTYGQALLLYKYDNNSWKYQDIKKFADPIHAIDYKDINNDGVKELLVLTLSGIHILQHQPDTVLNLLYKRIERLFEDTDGT